MPLWMYVCRVYIIIWTLLFVYIRMGKKSVRRYFVTNHKPTATAEIATRHKSYCYINIVDEHKREFICILCIIV